MTVDRQANARIIGQLEGQLAELELKLQRKAGSRVLNALLAIFGASIAIVSVVGLFVASALWLCWGAAFLAGAVLGLIGAAGVWDAGRASGRLQAEVVTLRTRLAEWRALMMG